MENKAKNNAQHSIQNSVQCKDKCTIVILANSKQCYIDLREGERSNILLWLKTTETY